MSRTCNRKGENKTSKQKKKSRSRSVVVHTWNMKKKNIKKNWVKNCECEIRKVERKSKQMKKKSHLQGGKQYWKSTNREREREQDRTGKKSTKESNGRESVVVCVCVCLCCVARNNIERTKTGSNKNKTTTGFFFFSMMFCIFFFFCVCAVSNRLSEKGYPFPKDNREIDRSRYDHPALPKTKQKKKNNRVGNSVFFFCLGRGTVVHIHTKTRQKSHPKKKEEIERDVKQKYIRKKEKKKTRRSKSKKIKRL